MEPFRIGLAMAGAVSAGAYTAGVLDFLVQALDAWTAAKANGHDSEGKPVPMHAVSLVAISGASAGSLCAAQLAVTLPYRYRHGSPLNPAAATMSGLPQTPLYTGWVSQIDIKKLLAPTGDTAGNTLPSLLNATVIDGIVADCLKFSGPLIERPWVAQPLVIRMTVGNLRGVPYAVPTKGTLNRAAAMTEHGDHMGFAISAQALNEALDRELIDHRRVQPHNLVPNPSTDPSWQWLTDAARASSAFPLALPPFRLSRPVADYNQRHGVDMATGGYATHQPSRARPVLPIVPGWDRKDAPDPYQFVCVDGGVFNNEPFQLAHSALLLGTGRDANPRNGEEADSAVVMIAPFNSPATVPPDIEDHPTPIGTVIQKLIGAWISQARFKPEDLALAQLEDVFSRFLIAPDRDATPTADNPNPQPLASGGLGGFFGFFHESFREHDYQLGRRNCQWFLREHFAVPDNNTCIQPGYAHLTAGEYRTTTGKLPIIPVMPEIAVPIPPADWPRGKLDVPSLRPLLAARLDVVWGHYRDRMLKNADGWWSRKALQAWLWAGWKFGRGRALDFLIGKLKKELETQQLLA